MLARQIAICSPPVGSDSNSPWRIILGQVSDLLLGVTYAKRNVIIHTKFIKYLGALCDRNQPFLLNGFKPLFLELETYRVVYAVDDSRKWNF